MRKLLVIGRRPGESRVQDRPLAQVIFWTEGRELPITVEPCSEETVKYAEYLCYQIDEWISGGVLPPLAQYAWHEENDLLQTLKDYRLFWHSDAWPDDLPEARSFVINASKLQIIESEA